MTELAIPKGHIIIYLENKNECIQKVSFNGK